MNDKIYCYCCNTEMKETEDSVYCPKCGIQVPTKWILDLLDKGIIKYLKDKGLDTEFYLKAARGSN